MDYPRASKLSLENAETKYLLAKKEYKEAKKGYEEWAHKPLTHPKRVLALQKLVAAKQKMDLEFATWNWLQLSPSESEFTEADTKLTEAKAALELAQTNYDALKTGIDVTKLTRAQVDLDKAKSDLALAEAKLDALELTAPFDGVILEVGVNVGQSISEGDTLMKITDPKALEVVTSVIEEDYALVKVGQPVELYFDAVPGVKVTGRVDRIIPKRAGGDRPLYKVYVVVDEVPDGVVDGMTADANIILDQRSDVLRLPRALVQAKSDNTAQVKVWVGDHEETRSVTVGLRGDVFIEILDGLKLGDQVVGQ
jgi:HlyD family secretion protein